VQVQGIFVEPAKLEQPAFGISPENRDIVDMRFTVNRVAGIDAVQLPAVKIGNGMVPEQLVGSFARHTHAPGALQLHNKRFVDIAQGIDENIAVEAVKAVEHIHRVILSVYFLAVGPVEGDKGPDAAVALMTGVLILRKARNVRSDELEVIVNGNAAYAGYISNLGGSQIFRKKLNDFSAFFLR
jgi:hypothetical protein